MKEEKQNTPPNYNYKNCYTELKELYYKARKHKEKTVELPTQLVGLISNWLIHLNNIESAYLSHKATVIKFEELLQNAQNIYNSEGRTDKKDKEIRKKLLGINKQRSIDAKGEPYDDGQLFYEYFCTVKPWGETGASCKKINDKKELTIKIMSAKYDIHSRTAFIGRLKRGKKQLIDEGEDKSQFYGVLPIDWPT